jgi:hypothetical protein
MLTSKKLKETIVLIEFDFDNFSVVCALNAYTAKRRLVDGGGKL